MHRVAKFSYWKRPQKFHNVKVERDGFHYDSKLEAEVGAQLELRMKSGDIKEIKRQVTFPLDIKGYHITSYRADFLCTMSDDSLQVFEAKGLMLGDAKIKLRLFEALYPDIKLNIVTR